MSKALITESYLEDIADSIRAKLGVQTTYLPSEMSAAIDSISGGGGGEVVDPFIEAQATTFVNTGVAGNTVYGILLEFTPITVANNYQCYAVGASNNFTVASMSTRDGVTSGYIRCGNVDFGIVTFKKGQKNTILCKDGKVTVNGVELAGSYSNVINTTSDTIKLFGGPSSIPYSHARIYNCILYDANGDVIHNYEPAVDSNYIPCFYDTISLNDIYGNNNRLTYGSGGVAYTETAFEDYAAKFTPLYNAQSARSGGFQFLLTKAVKVTKLRVFPRTTIASAYITKNGVNVASVQNATVIPDQWNDLLLNEPIILSSGDVYTVWYTMDANTAPNVYSGSITPNLSKMSIISAVYSVNYNTIPTSTESGALYGVDLYVESIVDPEWNT